MRPLLLMMACLSFPAFAESGFALIWGGGATPEAGQAAKAEYEKNAPELNSLLELSPGFPKVMESAAVKGMKPGFHVAVLGFCSEREAMELALSVAKSVEPKVYVRAVDVSSASCPKLKPEWKLVDSDRAGPLSLRAVQEQGQGHGLKLMALLVDEKGEALDYAVEEPTCTIDCPRVDVTSLTDGSGTLAVVVDEESPGCTAPDFEQWEWLVQVKKKRVSAKRHRVRFQKGACD